MPGTGQSRAQITANRHIAALSALDGPTAPNSMSEKTRPNTNRGETVLTQPRSKAAFVAQLYL